jgi:hypothetical protein
MAKTLSTTQQVSDLMGWCSEIPDGAYEAELPGSGSRILIERRNGKLTSLRPISTDGHQQFFSVQSAQPQTARTRAGA